VSRGLIIIALAAGCGRIGFDLSTGSSGGDAGDATGDGVAPGDGAPTDVLIPDGFTLVAISFGEAQGTTNTGVTQDTHVASATPTTNFDSAVELVGGGITATILLRFDLSSVPVGAMVVSAELVLYTGSMTDTGLVSIYPAREAWNAAQATWNQRLTATSWTNAGARPPQSRDVTAVHGFTPNMANAGHGLVFGASGIALVQSWITTPATNNGFAIANLGQPFSIHASTATVATRRPALYLGVELPN
jgi:hypothetical protein